MRDAPFEDIIDAMTEGGYSFTPVFDNRTFFSDYADRAKRGKQAHLVSDSSNFLMLLCATNTVK